MKFLAATQNQSKYDEIKLILGDLSLDVISLSQFPKVSQLKPNEDGETFCSNAINKASFFSLKTKLPSIADDSGICINALDGWPGVQSKRWLPGNSEKRNQKIIEKMKQFKDRSAEFVTAVALVDLNKQIKKTFVGRIKGSISKVSVGSQGFDYDRIFIPTGYEKTVAQLGPNIKNKISARFQALEKFKAYLSKQL